VSCLDVSAAPSIKSEHMASSLIFTGLKLEGRLSPAPSEWGEFRELEGRSGEDEGDRQVGGQGAK
jgi:hypothetical protein